MATLDNIATWVTTTMLKRTDITSEAREAALNFYKLLCSKIPFDELMTTSAELAMVAGTSSYSLAALGPNAIASIRITYGASASSPKRRLTRSHTRVYDSLSIVQNGRPATYARWGLNIEVNPPPDSSTYTYRVRYWSKPTILATPHDTVILLSTEWEELMRWETLWRVYNLLGMPEKAMALVMPGVLPDQPTTTRKFMKEVGIIPRLWNELLSTISRKENTDEDFSINPVVRAYSVR